MITYYFISMTKKLSRSLPLVYFHIRLLDGHPAIHVRLMNELIDDRKSQFK
jgi:hypothetical protein